MWITTLLGCLQNTEPVEAASPQLRTTARLAAVENASAAPLSDFPFHVEVLPGQIGVDGEAVLALEQGLVAEADHKGQMIPALYHRLETFPDADERVLLVIDERAPWTTVRQVVYTAGQAGFGQVFLLVEDATPEAPMPIPHPGWLVTVASDPSGVRVIGSPMDTATGPLDQALAAMPEEGPSCAVVVASSNWSETVAWMDAVAGLGVGQTTLAAGPSSQEEEVAMSSTSAESERVVSGELAVLAFTLPRIAAPGAAPSEECGPGFVGPKDAVQLVALEVPPPEPSEAIEGVLTGHLDQLHYCYVRGTRDGAVAPAGDVQIAFTITSDGMRIQGATVTASELDNAEIEQCLVHRIARFRFPVPSAGDPVSVQATFHFEAR